MLWWSVPWCSAPRWGVTLWRGATLWWGVLWWGAPWWGALWWGVLWWGMLWDVLWGCVVVGRDAGNLYLNSCFCREKVEKPSPACRESLPKTGKAGEMGRETKPRLSEIST